MFDNELEEMQEMRRVAQQRVNIFLCRFLPLFAVILLFLVFIFQCWEGKERKAWMAQNLAERQAVMRELYKKGAGTTVCDKKDGRWVCVDETGATFIIKPKG